MRLTTKSRYGLRMILDLALYAEKGPVPLSDIARRQNISMKYLEKLIRQLRRGGLVSSHRGAAGGYEVTRPLAQITVGDIVRILENCTAITDCAESDEKNCGTCNRAGDCLSQWVWVEASRALFERLDRITIAMLTRNRQQLIREVHAQHPLQSAGGG
ncbi:MAG: Rrf2 family transcriptional regulator [Desulfobacterales bacterium]|nr:Rrf2 family transcriptional regulator [Desulfobacterales bacterium]MBS3755117.1 Rrf2 family transcriptional regulator [Desulfobacterales bacterium]